MAALICVFALPRALCTGLAGLPYRSVRPVFGASGAADATGAALTGTGATYRLRVAAAGSAAWLLSGLVQAVRPDLPAVGQGLVALPASVGAAACAVSLRGM